MSKVITAFFTNRGVPATGLTPTITIYRLDQSSSSVVETGTLTEVGGGFYRYDFLSYNPLENYTFLIDGGPTLPASERFQYGGNDSYLEEIVKYVWVTNVSPDTTPPGSFGELITSQLNYVVSVVQLLLKYQNNRSLIDPNTKTLTIFDDDGVTPLVVFNLYDRAQRPSTDEVFEKVPI